VGAGQTVDTFSSCDRDEPDEDDFLYAAKVEEKRGRWPSPGTKQFRETFRFDHSTFVATPGFAEREEFKIARSSVIERWQVRVSCPARGVTICSPGLGPASSDGRSNLAS